VRDRLLRRVFAIVVERGFRFVTMHTLAERLRAVALGR
jgi:acetolactate synthase regulatory subunit